MPSAHLTCDPRQVIFRTFHWSIGIAACVVLTLFPARAPAGALQNHSRIVLTAPTLDMNPDPEIVEGVNIDQKFPESGSLSANASREVDGIYSSQVALSAFTRPFIFDFMGAEVLGRSQSPRFELSTGFQAGAIATWRDIIYAPQPVDPLSSIRLSFEIDGVMNSTGGSTLADLGVSATYPLSISGDDWLTGSGVSAGVSYWGELFDRENHIEHSGWDQLDYHPILSGTEIEMHGAISVDIPFNTQYQGYAYSVTLSVGSQPGVGDPSALGPFSMIADASSIRSIALTAITDSQGNPLTNITFDSGMSLVPEPSTIWLAGTGLVIAVVQRRRKHSRQRCAPPTTVAQDGTFVGLAAGDERFHNHSPMEPS